MTEKLGESLASVSNFIDFGRIRPIIADLYDNRPDEGGRSNRKPFLMMKIHLSGTILPYLGVGATHVPYTSS